MAGQGVKTKFRWEESGANHLHANACTVAGSKEEIALLFGTQEPGDPSSVRLSTKIVLNPFTAKKFAAALAQIVRQHDAGSGSAQRASLLFELVQGLDVPIGYEQSFKISKKTLSTDRFLLGVSKKQIAYKAQDRIVAVCERLKMPADFLNILQPCLVDANYVHFGFEGAQDACLYKVYVEFWDRIRADLQKKTTDPGPQLLHLGFKWDPFNPAKKVITRYTWHPWLTEEEIIGRLGAIADPVRHRHVFEGAEELVRLAARRMSHRDILYLEVTEDGNPRKSFDINVYRGGLDVGEVYALLSRLGMHYGISHSDFHRLYDGIRTKRLGHLAGGINREGKDFCTLYYGVASVERDQAGQDIAPVSSVAHTRRHFSAAEEDEQAALLLQGVKFLKVPFGFERSFKMARNTFLPDRFLTGLEHGKTGIEREAVLNLCRRLDMPSDFLAGFEQALPAANIVLFGFERNETKRFYKVYLEFKKNLREALEAHPDRPGPFPMFIGYKWDLADPSRKVVTNYTCYPAYLLRDMQQHASALFPGDGGSETDGIVKGILELASHRAPPDAFLYYEAEETGNERKSFSINLTRAGLRMAEIYPLLMRAADFFSIDPEEIHKVYGPSKSWVLSNLTGGTDRDGKNFLTLYYLAGGNPGKKPARNNGAGTTGQAGHDERQD